jgi:phosphoglycolate phosphatase-like HAD superfamily hydrolase
MTPLVLWDVDGTLVDAGGLGTRVYEVVFRSMFGRELTVVAPKAGRTDRAIIAETLMLAEVPEAPVWVDPFLAALSRYVATLSGAADATVLALPGAADALEALYGRAYQSVLTGNVRPLAELKLRAAGLCADGLGVPLDFDAGAYGDAHAVRAELVGVARRAARAVYGTDFDGSATVLVGDTPLDVAAALATGARAVGVATGGYSAAALADAGAHAVLPDLSDTARVLAAICGGPRPSG